MVIIHHQISPRTIVLELGVLVIAQKQRLNYSKRNGVSLENMEWLEQKTLEELNKIYSVKAI